MKTLKLNTNLIGLDGLYCTYWGAGQSEYTVNEDMLPEDFESGDTDIHPEYYWRHFDNKKYMVAWDKCVQDNLEEKLVELFRDELGIQIKYTAAGYYSPREYNFGHDENDFYLEGDFTNLITFCKNHEDFERFLKDNYTSCDGFRSNTSNNLTDWEEDINAMQMTAYGAAITFLIYKTIYDDLKEYSYEIFSDLFYSEFVDCTELDQFLLDLESGTADFSDLNDWQTALVERKLGNLEEATIKINDYYRGCLSVEEAATLLKEELGLTFDPTKIVKKYFENIDSQSVKLL